MHIFLIDIQFFQQLLKGDVSLFADMLEHFCFLFRCDLFFFYRQIVQIIEKIEQFRADR